MCECMSTPKQSAASMTGLREPAAKGATVSGIRAADINLRRGSVIRLEVCRPWEHTARMSNDNSRVWVRDLMALEVSLQASAEVYRMANYSEQELDHSLLYCEPPHQLIGQGKMYRTGSFNVFCEKISVSYLRAGFNGLTRKRR